MTMAVVFVLVARKDHGLRWERTRAKRATWVVAGEKCDQGPTCLLLCVLLYRFPNIIQPDGRKIRRGRRICV